MFWHFSISCGILLGNWQTGECPIIAYYTFRRDFRRNFAVTIAGGETDATADYGSVVEDLSKPKTRQS